MEERNMQPHSYLNIRLYVVSFGKKANTSENREKETCRRRSRRRVDVDLDSRRLIEGKMCFFEACVSKRSDIELRSCDLSQSSSYA